MNTVFRRLMVTAAIAATIAVVTSPAWASFPDQGNRILYGRQKSTSTMAPAARGISQSELFSIRTNGDDRRRVTDTARLAELGGAYSPDGDHIVYAARVADGTGVFRADADGSHRDRLTMNPVSSAPNWSRTGRQIVYVKAPNLTAARGFAGPIGRRGSPDSDLMVMDADGTGKHSIYFGQVYAPGWSPTDPEIAFTTSAGGPVGVALISAERRGAGARLLQGSDRGVRRLVTRRPAPAGHDAHQGRTEPRTPSSSASVATEPTRRSSPTSPSRSRCPATLPTATG